MDREFLLHHHQITLIHIHNVQPRQKEKEKTKRAEKNFPPPPVASFCHISDLAAAAPDVNYSAAAWSEEQTHRIKHGK